MKPIFKTIAFVFQLVIDVWAKVEEHRSEIKTAREEKKLAENAK